MRRKTLITACSIVITGFIIALSCQKPGGDDLPPETPPNPDGPMLPGTPYDYVGTRNNMPSYLSDYINADGAIDNTRADNPITNAGATLGRVLFYDKNLSVNNTIACASCHHQDKSFTDGTVQSKGFEGGLTRRNAMSIVNLRFFKGKKMFWDLRADDLEAQTLMPIVDHIEMGMPLLSDLEIKLKKVSYYPDLFKSAFGTPDVTSERISKALSQFLRSIVSFNSKYDQGLANNFADFTTDEINGKAMVTRAFCTECHSDLSHVAARANPSFLIVENFGINNGVGANNGLDATFTDQGIGAITLKPTDIGDFKIPALRNVELTAPYMHDGRFTTLAQVVDHYSDGIRQNPNLGIQLGLGGGTGFHFTDQQKIEIIAFLKTLTDRSLASDPKYSDPFKK